MNNNKHVTLVFPTPIWAMMVDGYEELNPKILEYINNLKRNDPKGEVRSNRFGWHSKNLNLNETVPREFLKKVKPCVKIAIDNMDWDLSLAEPRITSLWSIINPSNAYNSRHNHPNNLLSSAYYAKVPKNSGTINFYDPRPAAAYLNARPRKINLINGETYTIVPKEGLLVLFPSYLQHDVEPNLSNEERVILSFNLNLISNSGSMNNKI